MIAGHEYGPNFTTQVEIGLLRSHSDAYINSIKYYAVSISMTHHTPVLLGLLFQLEQKA